MSLSFGARLRRQRERRHVTLPEIAALAKVRVALFQSLERDDVSKWPPGVFRRSFVRSYAAAIGLDPDATVREFLELHPEPLPYLSELPGITSPAFTAARFGRLGLLVHTTLEGCRKSVRGIRSPGWEALACDLGMGLVFSTISLVWAQHFWLMFAALELCYFGAGAVLFRRSPGTHVCRRANTNVAVERLASFQPALRRPVRQRRSYSRARGCCCVLRPIETSAGWSSSVN